MSTPDMSTPLPLFFFYPNRAGYANAKQKKTRATMEVATFG